ncbi:hypothetical protein GE061_003120 [Apolygus lucorum]|uniref:Uncharacterized protein n=1 Tax=Apolygus lucorum TaxID=248454 RepID=A0A6A4JNF7_APOLU|nr:hypothetical protein GE061_003120 [Apolygus lucorum]
MNTSTTLIILGALYVLGASASNDIKENIKSDLQNAIDSADDITKSGLETIREAAYMKYKTSERSWKRAFERAMVSVLPKHNPFTEIREDISLMLSKFDNATEAEVTEYMAQALQGDNSFMKRIFDVGSSVIGKLTAQIEQLKKDGPGY